jgi:hypothetical protein
MAGDFPDPREEDIVFGDRRISRPDASLPDWDVPDTAYRAVPIVWFTGAMLFEVFALVLIASLFADVDPWFTVVLALIATLGIGFWTWARGMKGAGLGWKFATVAMLAIQLAFIGLVSLTRPYPAVP